MFKLPTLGPVIERTASSVKRFPFVYVSALICTAVAFLLVDSPYEKKDALFRILVPAMLGISWFFGLQVFSEGRRDQSGAVRWGLMAGGLALVVIYYFTYEKNSQVYFFRSAQLALASHLFVAVATLSSRPSANAFWQYNRVLFQRFLTGYIYTLTLAVGISFGLFAIDKLLGADIPKEAYNYVWSFLTFFYSVWFFVLGIPEDTNIYEQERFYPSGIKIFSLYILMPLAILYLAIFYAYLFKIIGAGAWPKGTIGYLVSGMAIVGIYANLFLDPLLDESDQKAVKVFYVWYYRLMLPAAVVLAMAVSRRVGEYGLTEKRYFLYIIAVWLAGLSVWYGFLKRRDIKIIPASLCVLALLSSFGPWGAYAMSLRNQMGRFEQIITRNNLRPLAIGEVLTQTVPQEDIERLSRIADYVGQSHGFKPFLKFLPGNKADNISAHDVLKAFGLEYVYDSRYEEDRGGQKIGSYNLKGHYNKAVEVTGYDYFMEVAVWGPNNQKDTRQAEGFEFKIECSQHDIKVYEGTEPLIELKLQPFAEKLAAKNPGNNMTVEEMSVMAQSHIARAKLVVKGAGIVRGNNPRFDSYQGYLLLSTQRRPANPS